MVAYYPGSKQKVKVYGPDYKPPVQEEELDLGPAKDFSLNGKAVTLYKLGSLAAALNRAPMTIRKWETLGFIPKCRYVVGTHDPRARRRLYTKEQIMGLREIANDEGILFPSANGKWKAVESTQFSNKALELFKALEG